MDEEIFLAQQSDAGFVLQFDCNLWAGENIIKGDPRPQNRNGRMFQSFLERHPHLTVEHNARGPVPKWQDRSFSLFDRSLSNQ